MKLYAFGGNIFIILFLVSIPQQGDASPKDIHIHIHLHGLDKLNGQPDDLDTAEGVIGSKDCTYGNTIHSTATGELVQDLVPCHSVPNTIGVNLKKPEMAGTIAHLHQGQLMVGTVKKAAMHTQPIKTRKPGTVLLIWIFWMDLNLASGTSVAQHVEPKH
eukprot:TRINITY_DN1835_c0_g1_i4.p1 TRINITY_DN1835_c0_g1~~TRINITY_DN1835_c0_g1_i4.p1  ORF type:complete len:160 (-),score=11.88 TRINITY_DN1835_c0_g1_i4:20-499(-)